MLSIFIRLFLKFININLIIIFLLKIFYFDFKFKRVFSSSYNFLNKSHEESSFTGLKWILKLKTEFSLLRKF